MARYAREMGFGAQTGVLLPSETEGLIPDPKWKREVLHDRWYTGESVNMSIGQGYVQVSPIQAARMMSMAASQKLLRPKLLLHPAPEEQADPPQPKPWKPETWKYLHVNLAKVVSEGTGNAAKIQGYPAAAKTGSAESGAGHKTHGWFVCYAPTQHPTIAMAIIVERGGHGGSAAGPVAQKLLMQHFGLNKKAAPKAVVNRGD